jgi:hypothetical protein
MGGVSGMLVASREPELAHRSLGWNVNVNDDGSFEAWVAPGFYILVFHPTNRTEFSQLTYFNIEVSVSNRDQNEALIIEYPSAYKQVKDTGDLWAQEEILVVKVVLISSQSQIPVRDMVVEGITDQKLRTNLVTPDEDGIAYLRLPASRYKEKGKDVWTWIYPKTVDLIVRPRELGNVLVPTITKQGIKLEKPDLGTFYVGEVPPEYEVSGQFVNQDGVGVNNCQVRFQAPNIGKGSIELMVETDEQGIYVSRVLGGYYYVMAVPGLLARESLRKFELFIEKDRKIEPLELPVRPVVTGVIHDSHGNVVPNVNVLAKRLGDCDKVDDSVLRTYESRTTSNGEFFLNLDPGNYEFTFIPLPGSGLPRSFPQKVLVTQKDESKNLGDIVLREPALIVGHVFTHHGKIPICGVNINVYCQVDNRTVLIGETVSCPSTNHRVCDGYYAVVIPTD